MIPVQQPAPLGGGSPLVERCSGHRGAIARLLESRWRWWWTALVLAAGGAILWWHAQRYLPFFSDDGFISLRYSQRLLAGEGLTWSDGERVEGYSNLLWVLACGLPGLLGFDLVAGARFVGWVSVVASMGALLVAVRPRRVRDGSPALVGMALLAASPPIAVWTVGGLEAPLVIALASGGLIALLRAIEEPGRAATWGAACCFGLLCWTRPDGALWGVTAVCGALLGYRARALRVSGSILGAVAVFVGAQLAFRLLYYGDWLPNPAYAKVAFREERLDAGLAYLTNSLAPLAATWCALGLGLLRGSLRRTTRPAAVTLLFPTAAWTAYVVVVGGDIFPAWRHWSCLIAVAAVAVVRLMADMPSVQGAGPGGAWEGASSSGAYGRWGVTLTVLALAGAWNDPGNWARDEKWEWNGKPVGRMLRKGFAEQRPLLAVDAAGALPFFSELPALDMLGLNDRYLARHRPADFGKGAIGHELGDADYYLARKPDLFCFGTPPCHFHAKFSEQRRMVRTREFRDAYVPTRFVSRRGKRRLVSELWLRLDGRIGLRVSDGRIDIPAYLLTGRAQGVEASLSRSGAFVTRWKPGRSSTLRLAVPPGRWNLIAVGARGAATLRVREGRNELARGPADAPLTLDVPRARTFQLDVQAAAEGFVARELTFQGAPVVDSDEGMDVVSLRRTAIDKPLAAGPAANPEWSADPSDRPEKPDE